MNDDMQAMKEALARAQADYQNLVRRVERDREDMSTYLCSSIIVKILPFMDNLERILSATPEEDRKTPLYEGVRSVHGGMLKTLEGFLVVPFVSLGKEVDAMLHDVMTQAP